MNCAKNEESTFCQIAAESVRHWLQADAAWALGKCIRERWGDPPKVINQSGTASTCPPLEHTRGGFFCFQEECNFELAQRNDRSLQAQRPGCRQHMGGYFPLSRLPCYGRLPHRALVLPASLLFYRARDLAVVEDVDRD